MNVLQSAGKDNIIYHTARCFGQKRPGQDMPRLPLDRMPFGIIAHNLKFFASDNVRYLQAPEDYKSWCQSMYTMFENKWASMRLGPLWSYELDCGNNLSVSANTSASTDILSQALQESFGDDLEILNSSAGYVSNEFDVVEDSNENRDEEGINSAHFGRTIRGDPLQVKSCM